MALDVNTISAVREELCSRVVGMRIDKVQQPQRDMIILTLRGRNSETQKLLICVATGDMRVHITEHTFDNPPSPPMFCMLLRKHLVGAKIEDIMQPPSERILYLSLTSSTAMGDASKMQLVLELFGRIPNIILTGSDGIIIDCLRRIGGDMNAKRMILPGLRYHAPEPGSHPQPASPDEAASQSNISKTLDAVYTLKSKQENMRRRSSELTRTMKTAQKRISRKLEAQRAELADTENRDYLRECGDIIMANMHAMKKGDETLIADDFYAQNADGAAKREIKLDPLLSPQKNAAKYYKAYTKARNAVDHLTKQIENGERELEYIDSVLEQISRAENERDLDEIRAELIQTKYLKAKVSKKNKNTKTEAKPQQFKSTAGFIISVGKNNIQNDTLTLKLAAKADVWFHTQKIHGTHVVVKSGGKPVDDDTIREAAAIAAYYSAARSTGKVAVDYTLVKNVKKPPGARPGMVIYTNFKTIITEPDEESIMRLKA